MKFTKPANPPALNATQLNQIQQAENGSLDGRIALLERRITNNLNQLTQQVDQQIQRQSQANNLQGELNRKR